MCRRFLLLMPYGALAVGPFAYDFHNPRFVGVAHGDALATAVVAILLDEGGHAADGLAGGGGALQRQPHEAEIVEQPVVVDQFKAAVEGGLDNGDLLLVHQSHHIVGVVHLCHIPAGMCGTPAVDGYLFARGMAPCGTVEERAGEPEAVAVVAAHHAAVGRGLLAHNQVGARHGRHGG